MDMIRTLSQYSLSASRFNSVNLGLTSVRTKLTSTMNENGTETKVINDDSSAEVSLKKDDETGRVPSAVAVVAGSNGQSEADLRPVYKWKKAKKMAAMFSFSGKVLIEHTVCPRSSGLFYIVSYYIKRVK